MVTYKIADTTTQMNQIVDLEIAIWGISERDAFPPHMLKLAQVQGGVVWIAESDNEVVGFCYAAPARRGGQAVLWSYVAGVHPTFQGQGIGRELKHRQREWAAQQGYKAVHWSFDPLQPRNANFNLNVLETTARAYHANLYGEMNDAINNAPLMSDRLEAVWSAQSRNTHTPQETPVLLLDSDEQRAPLLSLVPLDGKAHLAIATPKNQECDLVSWQAALRRAFEHALTGNYEVYRFLRQEKGGYYLLRPIG